MNTTKSLTEQTNDILKSRMSANKKAQALIKLGVTPYEAMVLARTTMPDLRKVGKPFSFTFGVEIECINCDTYDFMLASREYGFEAVDRTATYQGCHTDIPQFKLVPDGSISGANAAECVTPALKGTQAGFESLEKCCKALARVGAMVNRSCGLHVHIGARDLTDEAFCNVFVNYMRLELAIESFLAPSRRGRNAQWCVSLRNHETAVLGARDKEAMRRALRYDRYHRVNAEAYDRHQTIEFRQHQGSTNYEKISHWVKFLAKLVEWSRDNRLERNIDDINEIPFLTEEDKAYFGERKSFFETHRSAL